MTDTMQLRMYVFVPYNLSPIQQGIQALHASLEYASTYGFTNLFRDFVRNHKTVIVLNGGTTRDSDVKGNVDGSLGTMQEYLYGLRENTAVNVSSFAEPDLNHALTAFCFICDERVWDTELYPDYIDEPLDTASEYNKAFKEWVESIGGKDNAYLRLLLRGKRLA
jgi:hypothetical protein